MVFSMAAINAYLRENGLTRKCKRFSEYTRGQLRELFEYAGYDDTPILFTETDYGLEIRFYEANVIYLDVLQEINRLLSDLDDCIIRFDNGDIIVECYYDEEYIELLDEDEYKSHVTELLKKEEEEEDEGFFSQLPPMEYREKYGNYL